MSKIEIRYSRARILVVDDSDFERLLISTALKKAGFTKIKTASDGADAVRETYDFRPDLVLLDLNMPNLDGFGYCETVRGDATLPKMPIIVQTSRDDRQSLLRALSCGADDFLTKPLDMEELRLRICTHVERYFMFREMEDMCDYLKMEIDMVHRMRADVETAAFSSLNKKSFEKHCEVLEQLAHLSAVR